MAAKAITSSPSQNIGVGSIVKWLLGLFCFGVLASLLLQLIIQFMTPPPGQRLQLLQDMPLPSIAISHRGQAQQSIHFDRFDFQALDTRTGLLFIAHDGPSANKLPQVKAELFGASIKPSIVVFDVARNKYVASISDLIVHGITVASDIHEVYAADVNHNVITVIDEQACQAAISAGQNVCAVAKTIKATQTPDSLEYDGDDHEVFVSEADKNTPSKSVVDVVDTQTDSIVKTIPVPSIVGHVRYDPALHLIFIVVTTGTNAGNELDAIDPITNAITARIALPSVCNNAHGLAVDTAQQVAFVACVDSHNLAVVSLRTMKVIGDPNNFPLATKPDVVVVDHILHILFVGCATGVSVFDESKASSGSLTKFKDYPVSTNSSHSIAVDDSSHNLYIPLVDVGNRPVMRIEHYNSRGTV
ncbi:MAG: YncE family protein [Ktedonobacteraceae bacterium]|nr:YncE family protein [Ktedonobacteraceae bacterium]